jgi:hypothetical protein
VQRKGKAGRPNIDIRSILREKPSTAQARPAPSGAARRSARAVPAFHPKVSRAPLNQTPGVASPSVMTTPSSLWTSTSLLALASCFAGGCWPEEKARRDRDGGEVPAPPPEAEREKDDPDAIDDSCRTKKVDLLFVIDNSGSMSQEQAKLARTVPSLLGILATGNHSGKRSVADEPTDFVPAESIHVGVISTDIGINGAPSQNSCGDRSFSPTDPDTRQSVTRINKPYGDDGSLLSATDVAVAGIFAPSEGGGEVQLVVPPEPSCAEVELAEPFLSYEPDELFEDTGFAFSCISKLGRNGCGLEQQLEAMLKALTPAGSQRFTFSGNSRGQGTKPGTNAGFLRDDAILAVVHISDEEDCSIPDASRAIFDSTSMVVAGGINVRCGLPENQGFLQPVERYVEGLKALKPARYRDRIVFAGIVGLPTRSDTGAAVHSGEANFAELLERPDMQFTQRRNASGTDDEPVPTCVSEHGDGSAAPGRRFLEVAAAFGDHGLAASICEDSYQDLIDGISERISRHLGSCE